MSTTKYINRVKQGHRFTVLKKNVPVFNISLPELYDMSDIPMATKEDMEDLRKSKTVLSFKKEGGISPADFLKIVRDYDHKHGR